MPHETSPSESPAPPTPTQASRLTVAGVDDTSLAACFQCGKCTAGCPVADMADLLPHRIVRLVQLGLRREPLSSEHIWYCTGCGTCTSRCPNQVPVAELMDRLKAEALQELVPLGDLKIARFHVLFNKSVCKYGRQHELGTLRKLKSPREMLSQIKLGLKLLRRGKLRLRPSRIRDRQAVREIFRRAGMSK
jgi:heterodisulfide reductase subunit C